MEKFISGWVKQKDDPRDFRLKTFILKNDLKQDTFPTSFTLEDRIKERLDQGTLGSCGSHSYTEAARIVGHNQGEDFFSSRLFIYYNVRKEYNQINEDTGVDNRTMFKSAAKNGLCTESLLPYEISKFTVKPSDECYKDALNAIPEKYYLIDSTDINEMKTALINGFPFVVGFTVFQSFYSQFENHIMPLPKRKEKVLGGHDVLCVGYDDSKQAFRMLNSWGKDWGDNGLFWMPYSFITNTTYANDFWVLERIKFNKAEEPVIIQEQELTVDIMKIFQNKVEVNLLPKKILIRIGLELKLPISNLQSKKDIVSSISDKLSLV